ncbi:nuclear export mediator factor NEMF-like isoform X2 [Daphnia pulex]|uniref:nuclear export mediator factor NEMF-like isoform X2 n=1 Tax=Daphnia pulex TaxID=6669 RepID=UPI001EDE4DD2|nr:nuclear export mediator factor NEMF-like isoform X2 [Daphnia pulex]
MKARFTSIDIVAAIAEISLKLIGMRVNQIYDVDHKTYLIRLHRSEEKAMLLFESGIRIHTTDFQWPKNPAPSGFSMKLRKHLNNKRLEMASQVGQDRIINLQFGTGEAAYHVIIELYDRGNIVLCDFEYVILNILRPRTEGEDVRFLVKEKYPLEGTSVEDCITNTEVLENWLSSAKTGDNLKKILVPKTNYGPALIEHVLLEFGFPPNSRIGTQFDITRDLPKLHLALKSADSIMQNIGSISKGIVVQKRESRPTPSGENQDFFTNQEFHPMLYKQHESHPFIELPSFNQAVDEFFSKMESQKLDLKVVQQERDAMKKLANIRQDHEKRLANLHHVQEIDEQKARLIEMNQPLIDHAIQVVRSALANQVSWKEIDELVEEATRKGDPVAKIIKKLKLSTNHISLMLSHPYEEQDSDSESDESYKPQLVDIDLDLTAFANARKYFGEKKNASKKEQKTIESSHKAFKSAEKKAKQTLKESAAIATIRKARKVLWFEKFYWFISSDNYIVVGGRDRQQNELLVKRYLKAGDIYVHADLHGASSVIVKNVSASNRIPPRTLQEAGLMAVGYSAAWEAKVMTTAWWVESSQVSKTAPSGEYLTTGSFMIRGKKNFLPPLPIVLGFGLLFRLEESSIARHLNDRKPKALDDESPILDTETVDEPVSCSSDSESDGDEKNDYAKSIENARALLSLSRVTDNAEVAFPDTVVDMSTSSGNRNKIKALNEDESYTIIGDVLTINKTQRDGKKVEVKEEPIKSNQSSKKMTESITQETEGEKNQQPTSKRGQKGKMKKIKEKYKDQDEDERQLKMELLQSAGPARDKGKNKNKKKGKNTETKKVVFSKTTVPGLKKEEILVETEAVPVKSDETPATQQPATDRQLATEQIEENAEGDGIDEDVDQPVITDTDILNAMTGIPQLEDELLYVIPVVAPYSTLMPYKYKVKILPGQTKRGKASKTAMSVFLSDKTATNRERDLIKSLKDQDVGRNFPGRVKLAIPQSLKPKK